MTSDELHEYVHQGLFYGYLDILFWVSLSSRPSFSSSQYRNLSPGLHDRGLITAPLGDVAGEDFVKASQIPGREGYIYF